MAIKLEGGGGKALVARPLVDELFFLRLPLSCEGGVYPGVYGYVLHCCLLSGIPIYLLNQQREENVFLSDLFVIYNIFII